MVVGETERWHEWPTAVARAAQDNEDRFVFTGTLTGDDLAAVYDAADAFVFPSAYETYGLVTVEALSYGTPVVSTPVGIALELIEDDTNGSLFEAGDVDDLVSSVRRVAHADREAMRSVARSSVKHLRWEETVEELICLYERHEPTRRSARHEGRP